MRSVLQDWVQELSFMQQSVLICAIRGEDGKPKHAPGKIIHRYLRRCVLFSAFDGKALWETHGEGGGSFTGPMPPDVDFDKACTMFLDDRDSMALHYYMHFTHAVEILAYKHPEPLVSARWFYFYSRLVNALHLKGERMDEMDVRLGDSRVNWLKTTDYSEHTPQDKADLMELGRFGHHPDPAIDFCVEVEIIEGMSHDVKTGQITSISLIPRIEKALEFAVGGDEGAVRAKSLLRKIQSELQAK